MNIWEIAKQYYWNNKILDDENKERFFYCIRDLFQNHNKNNLNNNILENFIKDILENQNLNNSFSIDYPRKPLINLEFEDPKLIAYYLPQYYPNLYNNKWWGKGSTEWTNTTKAVPQYLGQYQPRLPGELGFYDLRIQENIYRQIDLAKYFGVYGFCFYFYWFSGLRLLELPFNNFINDNEINYPFCICWVNESWTKQWSGNSNQTLVEQSKTVESYKNFIHSCYEIFNKDNYIKISNKPILIIYKPQNIPDTKEVIEYWRKFVLNKTGKEIYIIATIGHCDEYEEDYISKGFDALSEFSPGPHWGLMNNITHKKYFLCDNFYGNVYDYKEFVENKKYFIKNKKKLFRAICPMWDNTARKKNRGMILDGADPRLYKKWLIDIIVETREKKDLDDRLIFINAWNEWAEGAYLEPDLKWRYGYLEATKDAILEARKKKIKY